MTTDFCTMTENSNTYDSIRLDNVCAAPCDAGWLKRGITVDAYVRLERSLPHGAKEFDSELAARAHVGPMKAFGYEATLSSAAWFIAANTE